ncbi:Zinc finger CCHC-type [Arabidopsis suecica]|uniref:Zinc finger CCHC-type n=1 Tax=Arabidopsis suecica TaxID=45249 RepID=A0A8T1YK99_ARASU|nr:Zinc finger CCHC-type [Arabidopsis suecica]
MTRLNNICFLSLQRDNLSAFSLLRRRLSRRRSSPPISFSGLPLLMGNQKKRKKASPVKLSSPVPTSKSPLSSPPTAATSPELPASLESSDSPSSATISNAQLTVLPTDLAIVSPASDLPAAGSVPAAAADPRPIGVVSEAPTSTPPNPPVSPKAPIPVTVDLKSAGSEKSDSWVNLVKGTAKELKKKGTPFTLPSGEACVKIPNSVIEKNRKSWDCFVLGQFYSDPPSQGTLHNIVNGIWSKYYRDVSVSKLDGNAFLFRIPNMSTRNHVINQRLWQIEGQTMFVAKWEPGVVPKKPELTSAPIWLELRHVPLQFFHEEGLEQIASLVGEPKFLHPTTANKTNLDVAKIFTIIDPRKPLPEAVNAQFENGEIARILVSSPWMPPVCSHCKEIGHTLKRCQKAPAVCSTCNSTVHNADSCPRLKPPGTQGNPRRQQKKHFQTDNLDATKGPKLAYVRVSPQTEVVKDLPRVGMSPVFLQLPKQHLQIQKGESSGLSVHSKAVIIPVCETKESVTSSDVEPDSSDTLSSEQEEEDSCEEICEKFEKVLTKKQRKVKMKKFVNDLLPGWFFEENYGFSALGKIWVLWHQSVKVVVISKSLQMVSCEVLLPGAVDWIVVSIIYASIEEGSRKELWEEIVLMANSQSLVGKAWILLGDFNQVLCPSEHSRPVTLNVDRKTRDFRECLLSADLADLTFRGNTYTWWNKSKTRPTAKKLDRILVNSQWVSVFPNSFALFGEPDFSDHASCSVSLSLDKQYGRRPFKFYNFLLQNQNFLPLIFEQWFTCNVVGSAMLRVSLKLKFLKSFIRSFNKENYSGLEKRVAEAHERLIGLQNRTLANPTSDNAAEELEAERKWHLLQNAESAFLMQRVSIDWLKEGDSNSSFFHRMIASRKAQNHIHYLLDSADVRLESQNDITDHCVAYFSELLGGVASPSGLVQGDMELLLPFRSSVDQQQHMDKMFTIEEIRGAFFSLPRNKTCGPDGYSAEFFTGCWSIIGPEVSEAVMEFFRSGKLLKQWNSTTLVLIPKSTNAVRTTDFRPISCLNTVYKVISKLLSTRLQWLLPQVISPSQSAFMPGRILAENVLLATEVVQGYNRKNIEPRAMLKVDIRKAFDSVNWDFILSALRALRIPEKFVGWISECITTPTFSVCLNGNSSGYFKSAKGLRQGDPLSPYLFVLAMEVFTRLLQSRFDQGYISYHPRTSGISLSHLMFADDVMIFFDGTEASLHGINETLDDFASCRDRKTWFSCCLLANQIPWASFDAQKASYFRV